MLKAPGNTAKASSEADHIRLPCVELLWARSGLLDDLGVLRNFSPEEHVELLYAISHRFQALIGEALFSSR